jgi:hypothetical protein
MSVVYRTSSAGGGTSGTGNRTSTISAVAGDLLLVFVKWSGNAATNPTCTDNQSGTYSLVLTALNNASADIMAIFVRNQTVASTATITVAPVVGSGTNTAGEIVVVAGSGAAIFGASAIRGSGKQENQTTGVPTPVLSAAALTGNMTIQAAGSTTTTGSVPNASWTERQNVSQITPTTVIEVATRDSGFTGTSAAYVSIASAVWCSAILEIDGRITSSQTQTGKARITISTQQTQTGKVRISKTTPQTQTGKARITATPSQTQTGKIRITVDPTQTQTGKASIIKKVFPVDTGGTLLTGLVAYYKLEDATEYYVGGGTYDLTNENTVAFNAGLVNNAADGGSGNTNKALNLANGLGINGGNFSMSMWIKLASTISSITTFGGQASNGGSNVGYEFEYDGTTLTFNRFQNGTNDFNATETVALSTGTWYHLVGTYDGTTLKLYRNNVAKTPLTTSGNGGSALTQKFVLFKNPTANVRYFSGKIDEVGVWSKALTTTEIADLYNGGAGQTMGLAAITSTQTQTGKSRITGTTSNTQTGKASVKGTTSQTQTGKARLTLTSPQTTTGKARITKSTSQTQAGQSRLTVTTPQTLTGKTRITKSQTQTQTGLSRITKTSSQTITGKARVSVTTSQTQTGKANLSLPRTQTGLARITKTQTQTQAGKSRVTKTQSQTQAGQSRITETTAQTQTGKANILTGQTSTQTQTGQARITATTSRTQTGQARIAEAGTQTQTGKARLTISTQQSATGRSRIAVTTPQTQTGTGKIVFVRTQTQTGKARILLVKQQTLTGKARVKVFPAFTSKYSARGTAFTSKLTPQGTQFTDRYGQQGIRFYPKYI